MSEVEEELFKLAMMLGQVKQIMDDKDKEIEKLKVELAKLRSALDSIQAEARAALDDTKPKPPTDKPTL